MYKPYDKNCSNLIPLKPSDILNKVLCALRSRPLKRLYRRVSYWIKYRTDYKATWDLDTYSMEWLIYHIERYLEDAGKIIDLNQEIEIRGVKHTMREACRVQIAYFKKCLKLDYWDEERYRLIEEAFSFYGKLAPYLWY